MNFATFYIQAQKDAARKRKKNKTKDKRKEKRDRVMQLPGAAYYPQPGGSDAPSASTFAVKG